MLRTNAGQKAAEARAAQATQKMAAIAADRRIALKATTAATLANLPFDLGRDRILSAAASAAFWGVSLPHWRRMYCAGKVPPPIRIGERKLGWRIGALVDALKARERAASGA